MIGTTRARHAPTGPELLPVDPEHGRYAVAVDGRVTYAGSREECEKRLAILTKHGDRAKQDHALRRVLA